MKRPVFGLIDCNNFFVSCERIFQPDLEGKPVVVLSSNDGCAVARSDEAKALGIPMAAPAFKYRDVFERHKVVAFSANFELYGDISRRITALLASITPRLEVYSIDESFLDLSELPIEDYTAWASIVRERLLRWVGVPVSIGIAPTKTLAKLASDRAKKQPDLGGVLNLVDIPSENITLHLEATAIESVWGIGRRLGPRLRAEGISNAWQLASTRPQYAQALMGIHGRHLTAELNGLSCFPLEREDKSRKSIARTRTFGEDMNDIYSLEAAIATFAATAAYRLRESGQVTQRAGLFLTTSRHKPGYQSWSREVIFDPATADTGQLIHALVTILQELHQPQARYHRAGIWLHDFLPADQLQTDLLGRVDVVAHDRATQRMQAIDDINGRFGRRMLRYATEDLGTRWQPRHSSRSPRYVSAWNELPQVRIVA